MMRDEPLDRLVERRVGEVVGPGVDVGVGHARSRGTRACAASRSRWRRRSPASSAMRTSWRLSRTSGVSAAGLRMSPASPPVQHTSTPRTPSSAYSATRARALRRLVVGVGVDRQQAERIAGLIGRALIVRAMVRRRRPLPEDRYRALDARPSFAYAPTGSGCRRRVLSRSQTSTRPMSRILRLRSRLEPERPVVGRAPRAPPATRARSRAGRARPRGWPGSRPGRSSRPRARPPARTRARRAPRAAPRRPPSARSGAARYGRRQRCPRVTNITSSPIIFTTRAPCSATVS